MSPKWRIWLGGGLLVAVIGGALYFPALRRQVEKAKNLTEKTAEQARRELLPPAPVNSGEPRVKAKMFWGSTANDGTLVPVTVELPLSGDPTLRAKEILNTLLAGPVDPEARTLPPDAALLGFYILADGTAVADFSEALASSIPSGIQSEQLAVDSITRTLQANVPQVQRLKILIHGQEVDTLAGHVDLTQTFQVNGIGPQTPTHSGVSVLTAPIRKAIDKVKGATKRQ
jgi:spore germination protein GerM